MAEPRIPIDHDDHDLVAVAAFAAADSDALGRLGGRLAGACDTCRVLVDDLRAIALATRELRTVPQPARRDFRLTVDDAARLTRRRSWRGLLSGPRPLERLGGVVAGLGLAGLLVAAIVPGGLLGPLAGGAATGDPIREFSGPGATFATAASAPTEGPAAPLASDSTTDVEVEKAADSAVPATVDVAVLSGAAVAAGLALVAVGRATRRPTA